MHIQLETNQPNIIHNSFSAGKKQDLKAVKDVAMEDSPILQEHKNKSGSSVAIAALATVCAVFMLSRGFQKNAHIFLDKIKSFLEEKIAYTSVNESKKQKKLYEFFMHRVNFFMKKSESINNITSLKDILFMKLMYKTEPTKKIHESISKYFEKISQKTVYDSYEKTEKYIKQMNKMFDELDEQILKEPCDKKFDYDGEEYTKQQLIEKAKTCRDIATMAAEAFINKKTIQSRYEHINKVTSSLYSTFWDASFKDFWSKNNKFKRREMWQTFIAADQIQGGKTDLARNIAYSRNAITYTPADRISRVSEYIKAIEGIIPPKDKEGIEIIENLKWFMRNPEIFHNNTKLFEKELKRLDKHKIMVSSDVKVSQAIENYKKTNIDLIDWQINDNKSGELQNMLSIYYKIAPFDLEKSGALSSAKRAVKFFDKSVDLESVEFFDKIRDLRLGSAPTDVLTILFSFITLSFGFGHAKDKDKRISIMLKSGIPIVGGIATAMYSATRLVSGGKSLALGFLSGIILNRLGKIADNIRKNQTNKAEKVEAN